jgi:DNA-binding CsgD family transcriptional regulator
MTKYSFKTTNDELQRLYALGLTTQEIAIKLQGIRKNTEDKKNI